MTHDQHEKSEIRPDLREDLERIVDNTGMTVDEIIATVIERCGRRRLESEIEKLILGYWQSLPGLSDPGARPPKPPPSDGGSNGGAPAQNGGQSLSAALLSALDAVGPRRR